MIALLWLGCGEPAEVPAPPPPVELAQPPAVAIPAVSGVAQYVQPASVTGAVYTVRAFPVSTPALADGDGRDLVAQRCSVCHNTTYITMQPPLPADKWAKEVDKMVNTFGAAIPADEAATITAYLQAHYTAETRQP
jgi:mono/diheme cytochrome c family protein